MSRPTPERRLAAILFTDIVGYTRLSQINEVLALELLEEHRSLVRPIFAKHGGTEIKSMGDGFLVEFASALEATKCAYDIQHKLHELNHNRPANKRIFVRAGIHLGDVVHDQNDLYGDAVNIASRIESLASAEGGICVTDQVYFQIRNKIEFSFVSLGKQELKNVQIPVEVYRASLPWDSRQNARQESEKDLDKRRIAVMPFVSISPDPADEYLADGMTEELITNLSGLSELIVIGRTSVMRYKTASKSLSEIGRELNVGFLVEGSVRKAAEKLRIAVQLIDSQSEGHIWAQNYDRNLRDIFAIQTDIAKRVTRELKVRLLDSEKRRIEERPTESAEVYMLYLKGRHFWNERSEEAISKAIEYFRKSLEIEPDFALGYSGLADCYLVLGFNGQAEFIPSFQKAKEYSSKALNLDPTLAEAHNVLGAVINNVDYDYEKSGAEFRRAIELNPNYPTAHQWYCQFLWFRRCFSEAKSEIEKALELDPFSMIINVNLGDLFYYEGEFDKAIEQYQKVVQMSPEFYPAHLGLFQAYVRKKLYDEAFREVQLMSETRKNILVGKLGKANVCASMGNSEDSKRLLKEVENVYEAEHPSPYSIAIVYFSLGELDKGFEWLNEAYRIRDSGILCLAIDHEFQPVKNDHRYLELLKKVGLIQTA